jgi:hypothetical protein
LYESHIEVLEEFFGFILGTSGQCTGPGEQPIIVSEEDLLVIAGFLNFLDLTQHERSSSAYHYR